MKTLQSTRNTLTVERRIRSAARQVLPREVNIRNLESFFEHGQWWIRNVTTGQTWSVVDAEGGRSVLGFDFEQITEAEQ